MENESEAFTFAVSLLSTSLVRSSGVERSTIAIIAMNR